MDHKSSLVIDYICLHVENEVRIVKEEVEAPVDDKAGECKEQNKINVKSRKKTLFRFEP